MKKLFIQLSLIKLAIIAIIFTLFALTSCSTDNSAAAQAARAYIKESKAKADNYLALGKDTAIKKTYFRCGATTKSGKTCKHIVKAQGQHCFQHQ